MHQALSQADIIIIGSGMGGATLAAALAPTGRRILILERGEKLADTSEARDDDAIFRRGHYRPDETWLDGQGAAFNPGNYYYRGGNSKFYGAVLIRFRKEDFSPLRHMGGTTAGWPIGYDDIEVDYQLAEEFYKVRGDAMEDPTEPDHSGDYPFPPVPDEHSIALVRQKLKDAGLHPSPLPLGVDLQRWLDRGRTPWDAFPDTCGGKMDAETVGLAKALEYDNVSIRDGCKAVRLIAEQGRIASVEVSQKTGTSTLSAPLFALSAGAVNSAALLLDSACDDYPNGLANKSDQVGRNFMNHNTSAILAIHPLRANTAIYQKTLLVNDFYLTGGPDGEPLGNIQLLGKISGTILSATSSIPKAMAHWLARHSVDFYAMSEDLSKQHSQVTVRNGQICLKWERSNWEAHLLLVRKFKKILRKIGFPIVLSKAFDRRTPSHQCGTARMGNDPRKSVVDCYCRSHDHSNLFITDASVLPTSAAVNPALTVMALAFRAARHIQQMDFSA